MELRVRNIKSEKWVLAGGNFSTPSIGISGQSVSGGRVYKM